MEALNADTGYKPDEVGIAEARARGAPVMAPAIVAVADPGIARSAYLLHQVSGEMRAGRSVLVADFTGVEGTILAGALRQGRAVLAEADSRDGIFPIGGFNGLPAEAREAAGAVFAAWLRPPGHFAESHTIRALFDQFARIPVLLPRTGLYAWKRYLIDRGFRRDCIRGFHREGLDPAPLLAARPGSVFWRLLEERVERVIGHDDALDRIFPFANPAVLLGSAAQPEMRVVQSQAPWSGRDGRYPLLLWLHLLAALAGRPKTREVGFSYVERFIVVEPPDPVCASAELLARVSRGGLRVTVVTAARRPSTPPEAWFGHRPAVIVQHALGAPTLSAWGSVAGAEAGRMLARQAKPYWFFVHQRGAPLDRWCGVEAAQALPDVISSTLVSARIEGRRRYLVDRAIVIENRRRIEAHAEQVARKGSTHGLLERAVRMERLAEAWRRTRRNKGVAGADRVTVETFGEKWQQHLGELQSTVRQGRYRPQPALRAWEEKASGGRRPLAIPAVVDRVLMGAAGDVLSAVLEPIFSDRSYAYRPGRGAHRGVLELMASPRLASGWALVADIASYFDTIDHRLLLAMLREHVADDAFIRLVGMWITNPVLEDGRQMVPRCGVPQGAPISPVLSNLFLTPLDRWMETRALDYVRYADDFVALCDSEAEARKAAAALEAFLARELKLSVKPTKTAFVSVKEGFEFLGFSFRGPAVRIPKGRLEEARLSLRALLESAVPASELLVRLDAYVRGFRNYFDLSSPATTGDLRALEAERVDLLQKWAIGWRLEAWLVLAQTERFVVEDLPVPAPGAYGGETTATNDENANEYALPCKPAPAQLTSLASVDRRPAAVLARAGRRPAAVNAAGHIGIFGYGAMASVEQDRMVLRKKRDVVFEAPIEAMRTLQVDSYGIVVTTPLLEKLAEHDIPVLFARHGERPWAVLRPLTARGSGDLLGSQIAARGGPLAILVAKELIGAKLANQERLLRYYAKYSRRRIAPAGTLLREGADRIASHSKGLLEVESEDLDAARRKVFSIEGRAGAAYWSALRTVLTEDFHRIGLGATDPINAALNYGYGVLYAAVWGAIGRAGLEPGIGVLHASPGDRGALVFDLVEPFRVPVVDRPVIGLVSRGKVLKLNTDGHLTAGARRHVAVAVGQALDRKVPWDGADQSLADYIEGHAKSLAIWLQGGQPLRALRIRW